MRLKIGLVVICLGVAGVLLAQYFGVITLWGGTPTDEGPTEEVRQFTEEAVKQRRAEQQRIEAQPPSQIPPPPVGSD